MRVKFLVPGHHGSASFWSSYVLFRVYCFAKACDTPYLSREWCPLSSGVVWERENVIFIFNRRVIFHVIVAIICLHVFSTLQQFLQRPRRFASFCSFWHLSYLTGVFLLAYHFKIGKQLIPRRFFPATTHHLAKLYFVLGTLLFFEPVS